MTEDQNVAAISEFQTAVEDVQKCIKSIPFDLESTKEKLDKVKCLLNDFFTHFIEKHHGVGEHDSKSFTSSAIHYTSIGTLVSILQHVVNDKECKECAVNENNHANSGTSDSLRAYDSVHFNDPDEGKFFTRYFPKQHERLLEDEQSHAYIASFVLPQCDRDMADDLVFWRTYGKDGEGCSLSFFVEPSCLGKVLYGKDKAKNNIKELEPVLGGLHTLREFIDSEEMHPYTKRKLSANLAEINWDSLEKIRYLYKSEAYEYEKECRFVRTKSDIDTEKVHDVCFEYRNNNIRHYYEHEELKVSKLLVSGSKIILGPCVPHSNDVKYCIEALLKSAKLSGPTVKLSKIDYRKS